MKGVMVNRSFSQAVEFVKHLRLEGVSVWADQQGRIHIFPAVLKPDDRELIRAHKPAVVDWLRRYAKENCLSDDELRRLGWLKGDHQQ
jgi:hypothetical protein